MLKKVLEIDNSRFTLDGNNVKLEIDGLTHNFPLKDMVQCMSIMKEWFKEENKNKTQESKEVLGG